MVNMVTWLHFNGKILPSPADEVKQKQRLMWKAASQGWRKWERLIIPSLQSVSDLLIEKAGIREGYSVLDVASGTGEPALTIARTVGPRGKVVGVDLSPEMLEVARERMTAQAIENVTFQVNDDDNLPLFRDNSFDAAVCRFGLMFMPDPAAILRSMRRTLKPGGKASVSVWGPPEKAQFFTTIMNVVSKHVPETKPIPSGIIGSPFAIPSSALLGDIFRKAGFSDFNSEIIEVAAAQTDSAEEYWEWMSQSAGPIVSALSKLSREQKEAIRGDVLEKVHGMFPAGPVRLTGEVIIGTGTK
jgi:ubiquinone/menaquinone biosynthesis C-methylase UbiE